MSAISKGTIVAAMLAGFTSIGANSAASEPVKTFKPLHGISLHVGSKHAVGYYEADGSVCELTLVVGEDPAADESVLAVTPARFRASVKAGQHVRFDTGEGKELAFYCGPAAAAMSVETMQQTAYTPAAR
jgi:hypothetical protein